MLKDNFSTCKIRIDSGLSKSPTINVQLFDILGNQVKNETLTNNALNVSNLNTGIYILKITQNNASVIRKLVIK